MRFRRTAGRLFAASLVAIPLLGMLGAAPLLDRSPAATPPVRPAPSAPASPSADPPSHVVMALGDSVPSGMACLCDPFPQTYGSMLSARTGSRVTVDNRAVSGLDTSDLITQLNTPAVEDAVRRADVFLVTIGANDFGDHHDQVVNGECGSGDTDCVSDELESLRANLTSVLAKIRALRQGKPTSMLVTGYWNVFQDGAVARRAFSAAGFRATRTLTFQADEVIRDAAERSGATFVGLYAPFHGPAAHGDVTNLLASDGDHPNAAGQSLIAERLLAAGLGGLVEG